MKINWGTAIVIAFACFISFIMYFVIRMSTNTAYEHDLVVEDYYGQELEFQNDIDKEEHSKTLASDITWIKTKDGIEITFPKDLSIDNIKGNVFLYRPSNKNLDFETPISLSNHTLLIPDKSLLDGRWNLKVDWKYNTNLYLYKTEISY